MAQTPIRLRRGSVLLGAIAALLVVFGAARPASAHTDFDSSTPADGQVVAGPLDQVVVGFTNPAQPVGAGFELLDATGTVRNPSSVDETDGTSFVLTFDPPLGAGSYGVRWNVRAGDAHPIEGSFRFEVAGAATTTVAPSDQVVAAVPSTSVAATSEMAGMDPGEHAAMSNDRLDELLTASSSTADAAAVGRVGRAVTMLGTVFGVGVLAALLWTVRGRRDELHAQLGWIRLAGWVVLAGGLIELAALVEADAGTPLGDMLSTKAGLAAGLKMAGGLAVVLGFHRRAGRIVAPARPLSAAVAAELVPDVPTSVVDGAHVDGHRWSPTSGAALGLAGYATVLASFWFDGHTVSKGPWVLHAGVNLVHLGAAAVWAGGVFAMTTVAWMRHRRSERTDLAAMVVRFSSIATVSLAAVVLAGLAMTWMILESPGDLSGTTWGRTLIAKTLAVAVAAVLGGYNHFRLRPALERHPDDPALARHLRISLSIESAVMVAVIVLAAVLVAAAT